MHVVYFLSRFPNLTTTFTFNEMLSLRSQGHRVTVVSLRPAIYLEGKTHSGLTPLVEATLYAPLRSPRVWWAFFLALGKHPAFIARTIGRILTETFPNPFAAGKALVALIKSPFIADHLRDAHVDHLHGDFASIPATGAMLAADLLQKPFSFTCHAFDLYTKSIVHGNSLMRCKIGGAAFVVAVHRHARDYLVRNYGSAVRDKCFVVRIGVDLDLFVPGERLDAVPGTRIIFLSVANFMEKKGLKYLLQAARILLDRGVDFECVIVGDGQRRPVLERLHAELDLGDTVRFLGAMTHDDIVQWYARAHAFVLPCVVTDNGDMDGIPTVLVEAMSSGLATISTPIAGIPELIRDGETGLLVESRNADHLADAMQRLVSDAQLRSVLAVQGRAWTERHFDTHQNARRMAQLFAGEAITHDPMEEDGLL